MFCNGIINNYNISSLDISLYDGIPKRYSHLKYKNFMDWEIRPWDLYIFKDRKLGEGSFSNVYLAKCRETFVVAKIIKDNISKELVLREIDIMSKLHHPNIVQFLGYIDDPFIIVMEYIPFNCLLINKLSNKQKINIIKDILKGLAYIHNRLPEALIHRDIKPSNILLTNSKSAKIADFGLSKFYNIANKSNTNLYSLNNNLTSNTGTDPYIAPEIYQDIKYTNSVDIYSLGIMCYEIFENKKYRNFIKFYYTPKKMRNIILNMISLDFNIRYSALNILHLMHTYKID